MRIAEFEPRHGSAWKALNEAWITRHFSLEPGDRKVLDDPDGQVLQPGGQILIAEDEQGQAVGCVGLMVIPPSRGGGFEVIKMTVGEAARGVGLGRALLQACIDKAARLGASRLYLETNVDLAPALALDRAMGFVDLPRQQTPYARCNVWMARSLQPVLSPASPSR
jgi:GNAT superfamily N-acetyltransferase